MNTKDFEPTFQLIANTISEINLINTINNISNSDNLHKTFSINMKDIHIEEHKDYKSAGLDVEVVALIQEKIDNNPKKFEIQLTVTGIFSDTKTISNEDFEGKLKINGVAALYSIARGCITNISSQSLAEGKVILPLVNFIEVAQKTDNNHA